MAEMIRIGRRYEHAIDILRREYDFRNCRLDEVEDLQRFIDEYWKKNHILSKNRELLDWMYLDQEKGEYHFTIAKHRESGEIHAINGYIPTSQFDKALLPKKEWGALWKAREDVGNLGLGIAVAYQRFVQNPLMEYTGGCGISKDGLKNGRVFNEYHDVMKHFFLPNPSKRNFRISKGLERFCSKAVNREGVTDFHKIEKDEFMKLSSDTRMFRDSSKYKSKEYYINRYMKHPIYKYDFYMVGNGDDQIAFIMRSCKVDGNLCHRIVDYIGDIRKMKGFRQGLKQLLLDTNAEYIDFLVGGLDRCIALETGFLERHDYPEIILPNYFEPFVKENVDLFYEYTTIPENGEIERIMYKGDADQDRPNCIL